MNDAGEEYIPLFDANESFNRALAVARTARGEPIGGFRRSVWKMGKKVSSRFGIIGTIGLGTAVIWTGFQYLRQESIVRKRRSWISTTRTSEAA